MSQVVSLNLLAVREDIAIGVEQFVRNVLGASVFPEHCSINLYARNGVNPENVLPPNFFELNYAIKQWHLPGRFTVIRIFFEMFILPIFTWRDDIVLSVNNFGPVFGKYGQRRIVVIHDVWFESINYEGSTWAKWCFRLLLKLQIRFTDRVITVSDFSRRQIRHYFKVPYEKIEIIGNCLPASDVTMMREKYNKEFANYLVVIGSERRNKNIDRVMDALYRLAQEEKLHVKCIKLLGYFGTSYVQRHAQTLFSVGIELQYEGFLDRSNYIDSIKHSEGVVFASLYEGFGIPVIESILAGKRVIVSEGTVCEEIAGAAGITVNGSDIESIGNGICKMIYEDIPVSDAQTDQIQRKYCDCKQNGQLLVDVCLGYA